MFWRDDFISAWKLLISQHIVKATGMRQGQPTGLQLQVQEWHLRAAFENDRLVHTLLYTYAEKIINRSMRCRTRWGGIA